MNVLTLQLVPEPVSSLKQGKIQEVFATQDKLGQKIKNNFATNRPLQRLIVDKCGLIDWLALKVLEPDTV